MTVKQCAAELGVSVSLLREMLRNGLLAGEKRRGQWVIQEASVDSLRQAVRTLRGALPGAHDESCFSWLYDPEVQDVMPSKPWKAPMPPVTDAWLGEPPPAPPTPAPTEAPREAPPTPAPRQHWEKTGDACPRCQQPLVSQFIDADLGYGWICPDCQLSPTSAGSGSPEPSGPVHTWHSVDFEIDAIVRKT